MPMIPLGLKETKEIEMQEPFRVCPNLSVSYRLLIVVLVKYIYNSYSTKSPLMHAVIKS
jgi:hypothetical protein